MKTLKVLVVDDEPGICSGIKRILSKFTLSFPFLEEDFGFEVDQAGTGEEGIKLVEELKHDIVLLDNKLPGIQGIEVLEYIHNKNFDCKVAMITSYPSMDVAIKASFEGASDFIPKPFTPDELKASISTIAKQLHLKRITSKLKQAGKHVRYQFLSVLSHELKSPLNAITGYLEMMKAKQMGDNIDDYLSIIDRTVARANGMKTLILDLLDLTKIRSERKESDMKNISLMEIAKYAIDTARPYAIQRDIKISLQIQEDIIFKANPDDIEIIFNNLISNAVKYNVNNGHVYCRINKKENKIIIEVEDTGIGMTEEEISKLFNEFVRIKNEKTKYITGSGLGLSILKRITEIYNGEINVESKENEGSTFTVILPAKA